MQEIICHGCGKLEINSPRSCQRPSINNVRKDPLQPLHIISEPCATMAMDIVGPFTRSKSDYRFILPAMCLFTRYPEAIPLKKIDVESVTEAMLEIFSRHGVPDNLLTDHG